MKLRRPQHPERIAIIAIVLLIVVNVAIIGTRSEVRGAVVPERSPVIFQISPQEGEDIVPQAPLSSASSEAAAKQESHFPLVKCRNEIRLAVS